MPDDNEKIGLDGLRQHMKNVDETLRDFKAFVKEIRKEFKEEYVTQIEFKPVKQLVFGAAKIALVTVVSGVVLGGIYVIAFKPLV